MTSVTSALPVTASRMVAELWAESGGRLRGQVLEREGGAAPPRAPRWSSDLSTPVSEVVREMNKTSNNEAARSMLLSLAVGAAAETPQRFPQTETLAVGQTLTPELTGRIGDAYADAIDTLDDMRGSAWYRTEMVRVWVRRAIATAADAAAGRPAAG